mgnify:CR=1 FL=1
MSSDEQLIIDLSRENASLKADKEQRKSSDLRAEIAMSEVKVPNGFEDGNSWDDYGFHERVHILCDMLTRSREENRAI